MYFKIVFANGGILLNGEFFPATDSDDLWQILREIPNNSIISITFPVKQKPEVIDREFITAETISAVVENAVNVVILQPRFCPPNWWANYRIRNSSYSVVCSFISKEHKMQKVAVVFNKDTQKIQLWTLEIAQSQNLHLNKCFFLWGEILIPKGSRKVINRLLVG